MTPRIFQAVKDEGSLIYPRLPWSVAEALIHERVGFTRSQLEDASETFHPKAPTARIGTPVSQEQLALLRDQVRSSLKKVHTEFPWPVPKSRVAEFDRILGACLYNHMSIVPSDAAAEGVWSFLTLVLLPEVGPWRFPGAGAKRYRGVHRNVLRRTWWRAHVLGPELGGSSASSPYLGEDELVQIFERSSLAANPHIAKSIVASIRSDDHTLPVGRSEFVRDLTRRLLRLMPLVSFDALDEGSFDDLLRRQTGISIQALKADPPKKRRRVKGTRSRS